jgi:hypothetical protein
MEITIPVFTVVLILLTLNSVLEHVFNWIVRLAVKNDTGEGALFLTSILFYVLKWGGVIVVLDNILNK